ncbi:MAG TPA: universal stress protein [Nitrospirae bacterium]|nr:putative universal stress protein [bacterium BMS3Abin09]GBE40577.1 putative universal stress protein [bacterium BMS3Bbin09]HDH34915.1 universal stress protein [Nitrospirota bacterium]HDZ83833.1 universal stress protein [Nitrospirota bacterium]
MYKKILLAVDGSDASGNAIKHAIALAKNNNGTLIALYVISPIYITDIETFKPEMLYRGLKQEGEKILADIKELAGKDGVEVMTRIEDGIPDEIICEVAGDSDADLIIMGSHGRTGFGKVFIGSVTERVISKEKCCPVLVVR